MPNASQVSSISGSSSEDDEDVAAQPRHRTPQSTFVKEGEMHVGPIIMENFN